MMGCKKGLVDPKRRHIESGDFERLIGESKGLKMRTPVQLHLFNDTLVISKFLVSSFRFSEQISLLDLFVNPNPPLSLRLSPLSLSFSLFPDLLFSVKEKMNGMNE